jgi:hypothetical protein
MQRPALRRAATEKVWLKTRFFASFLVAKRRAISLDLRRTKYPIGLLVSNNFSPKYYRLS